MSSRTLTHLATHSLLPRATPTSLPAALPHAVRLLSTSPSPASPPAPAPAPLVPPFTLDTATRKVQMAQDAWNSCDPQRVSKVYTPDSVWRNRDAFFQGRPAIVAFLTAKWATERDYKLRKKLHSFHDNKIAVNFWYEFYNQELATWQRAYGLEHWDFDAEGLMYKRHCSANNVTISEEERWFKDGVDVDAIEIDPRDG